MEATAPLRKSLALVFCDIVGSTRLIARVGDLVASAVFREFVEHAGRLGRRHHSLMIKFLGDGFLAAFENMDDAMPFVISIESLLSPNSPLERLEGFHFSLHYGNVLFIETSYGNDVLGEDVNLVANLSEIDTRMRSSFRRPRWSGCRLATSSPPERAKLVRSSGSET